MHKTAQGHRIGLRRCVWEYSSNWHRGTKSLLLSLTGLMYSHQSAHCVEWQKSYIQAIRLRSVLTEGKETHRALLLFDMSLKSRVLRNDDLHPPRHG